MIPQYQVIGFTKDGKADYVREFYSINAARDYIKQDMMPMKEAYRKIIISELTTISWCDMEETQDDYEPTKAEYVRKVNHSSNGHVNGNGHSEDQNLPQLYEG